MGELTSGQKEILKTINDVTEDTINIFKDLLTVIDIQEDHLHLEISEYSIESLWTSMVWDLKQQAERKKIKKLQFH